MKSPLTLYWLVTYSSQTIWVTHSSMKLNSENRWRSAVCAVCHLCSDGLALSSSGAAPASDVIRFFFYGKPLRPYKCAQWREKLIFHLKTTSETKMCRLSIPTLENAYTNKSQFNCVENGQDNEYRDPVESFVSILPGGVIDNLPAQ